MPGRTTTRLIEVIEKDGEEWVLYSHDKSKVLGRFKTKKEAEDREKEIQAFKHMTEAEQPKGTVIQTLIFDKDKFTVTEAKAWAKDHDFNSGNVDEPEAGDTIRIRQRDPGDFAVNGLKEGGKFKIMELADGIKAVIGRLKEAMMASPDSMEGMMGKVRDAYYAAFNDDAPGNIGAGYVEETHDDHVIISKGGKCWKVPYSETNGKITFGDPIEVEFKGRWQPIKESVISDAEEVHLLESLSADGSEWIIRLIKPGWSKNKSEKLNLPRYYPESTLQEATPLFDGVDVYAHYMSPHIDRPGQQSAQAKIGWLSEPRYEGGTVTRFTCVDPPIRTKLKEAWNKGKHDFLGFSIDADGREEIRIVEGKRAAWVAEIARPYELSVVTNPAAGGEFLRLVASADGPSKEEQMERLLEMIREIRPELVATPPKDGWTEDGLKAVLKEAMTPSPPAAPDPKPQPIPDVTRLKEVEEKLAQFEAREQKLGRIQRFREALAVHPISQFGKAKAIAEKLGMAEIDAGKDLTSEQIKALGDEQLAVLAEATQSGKVIGLGSVQVSQDAREKLVIHAMDGLFEGKNMGEVPRFTSLHEAYCRITGKNYFDLDNRAIFRECVGSRDYESRGRRLTESITTGDWAQVFGDSITRKLLRDYSQSPQYDAWRSIVSEISSPKDFRTQRRVRIGGYGALPIVGQGSPYQPLTSPGDEEVTYVPAKRGGTEDLTWEDVLNDDLGAIRQIPIRLARAAKITLYEFVIDMIRDNPTIYDGVALFHSTHANIEDQALASDKLLAAELLMRRQSGYGEASRKLSLRARYMMIADSLIDTAFKLLTGDMAVISNENATTPNYFKGKYRTWQGSEAGEPYHVMANETGTTAWYLIADPQEVPTIEIGFLGGQEEPELFVQDDERSGSRFSADKITYKIRHIYGGIPLEYRGFVRGNV